jgi:hypothetical protein
MKKYTLALLTATVLSTALNAMDGAIEVAAQLAAPKHDANGIAMYDPAILNLALGFGMEHPELKAQVFGIVSNELAAPKHDANGIAMYDPAILNLALGFGMEHPELKAQAEAIMAAMH